MAQHDVEMIVLKQVASYLAMPIFLVDLKGNLLYFHEPAEAILGRRYDDERVASGTHAFDVTPAREGTTLDVGSGTAAVSA